MEIFPAIDLSGGQVVRLRQGRYEDKQVYGSDPVSTARSFLTQGARNLHVVDLDGAKTGRAENADAVRLLCTIPGLFVQVGGGIRDEARVEELLSFGAGRVILGTAAIRNFSFVKDMAKKYSSHIAAGVDARDGKAAISGWLETTGVDALSLCERLADAGIETVIFTDIARDGRLMGANLAAYRALRKIHIHVIASGGISFEPELAVLQAMGIYGAIIGKALYEAKLDLGRCIAIADEKEPV